MAKNKGGDYEGWVLRLIEKPEDIVTSYSMLTWLEFAAEKIEAFSGQGITKRQIAALESNRDTVFELPAKLGLRIVPVTRYRDARGRWTREKTDRPVQSISYRNDRQQFVSRAKVNSILTSALGGMNLRKKKEGE
jgi:hypothetical protein